MSARPEAFGLLTVEVDGQNVRAVHQAARQLVARARGGQGPAFLLCHTYRFLGHHVGDINRGYYRSKDEELDWQTQRDPLKVLAGWLSGQGLADAGMFAQIESDVRSEVEAAVAYALDAPFPAPDEVRRHVYAS
jgi:pyruvate dehydrogenase E1 component alpha subunit